MGADLRLLTFFHCDAWLCLQVVVVFHLLGCSSSLSLYEVVGHYSDILGPVVRCHGVGCSELLRLK